MKLLASACYCAVAAALQQLTSTGLTLSSNKQHSIEFSPALSLFESFSMTNEELPFPKRTISPLPPYWNEAQALNRKNFERDATGRLMIDAWDYMHRMSLYKHLVDNIDNCAWHERALPSIDNNIPINLLKKYHPSNIIWGLPLQHGWQYSSSRLMNDENRSN